jgi:excisionase family DNA binding protein
MPKPRKAQTDATVPISVTSSMLAQRTADLWAQTDAATPGDRPGITWRGATLSDLLRPDEVLVSNRRALLEPDERVDAIVHKEMEAIKRIEQAFPADMDPLKRDEVVGLIVGHNILHWMSVQQYADTQPSPQQKALVPGRTGPRATKRAKQKLQQETKPLPDLDKVKTITLEEAARFLRRSYRTVQGWMKSGKLPGFQIDGKGQWVISSALFKRFLEENAAA